MKLWTELESAEFTLAVRGYDRNEVDEFIDAADVQSGSLGVESAGIYVRHPIQDRTDDEMREIADGVFERVVAELLGES